MGFIFLFVLLLCVGTLSVPWLTPTLRGSSEFLDVSWILDSLDSILSVVPTLAAMVVIGKFRSAQPPNNNSAILSRPIER